MYKRKINNIVKNYLKGRLRLAEFAITNCCIAKCSFCDIWKQKPKVITPKDDALFTIDRLADFGVSQLTLTGGEPLLHPNVIDLIKRASRRNIVSAVLVAAPQLLIRKDMASRLEDAGCDLVCISYDSGDPDIMAKSRQIANIMDDMEKAMGALKKTGLKTMASVLIWNDNYNRLDEVCRSASEIGFNVISLNYPTFSESSIYTLGGEGIRMSREDLIQALEDAIRLKKVHKYGIINPVLSMQNIISYLKDMKTAKFPCYGGNRVLFVDWFCNVHPCMQIEHVINDIWGLSEDDLRHPPCNKCNMSWYRDFSTLFHGIKSVPVLFESISSTGKLL